MEDFDSITADNMYRMVSEMHPDEAEMFTRMWADEVYEDLVSKNQRLIVKKNAEIALAITAEAEEIAKSYIAQGRDEEAIAVAIGVAAGLSEIHKGRYDNNFNQRGPDGKFSANGTVRHARPVTRVARVSTVEGQKKVKLVPSVTGTKRSSSTDRERRIDSTYEEPQHRQMPGTGKKPAGKKPKLSMQDRMELGAMGAEQKFQGASSAAKEKAERFAGDAKIKLNGAYASAKNKVGDVYEDATTFSDHNDNRTLTQRAEAIQRPLKLSAEREEAFYNALSPKNMGKQTDRAVSAFDQYNAQSRPMEQSNMDRAWYTMQDAGTLASGVGGAASKMGIPGGSSLAVAGQAANLAGRLGPNAEKIVGPSVRRAKYRAQGTERPVDKDLSNIVRQKGIGVLSEKIQRLSPDKREEVLTKVRNSGGKVDNFLTPDSRELAAVMGSIDYMTKRIPDARRNNLRTASGKVAPSEGVIISQDGDVLHQSMGVTSDHYLPFSAKNLKDLKGGTYVRTRTMGGPTTEDIRAGLMTGLKSIVVVSHSGVFQVDFDDDIPRNSNRAKQMVDRYGKILDAVQSKEVTKTPLSGMERAEIEERVEEEIANSPWSYNEQEKRAAYKAAFEQAMSNPKPTKDEMLEAQQKARAGYSQGELDTEKVQRDVKVAERAILNRMMEAKAERVYTLNGKGYQSALETLQDEFPYFISVKQHHTSDEVMGNLGMDTDDSGYVKARFLNPEKERHGYFGEGIDGPRQKGGTKRAGDTTEYQNWRYNKQSASSTPRGESLTTEEQKATAPNKGATNAREDQFRQFQEKNSIREQKRMANVGSPARYQAIDGGITKAIGMMRPEDRKQFPALSDWSQQNLDGKVSALMSPKAAEAVYADLERLAATTSPMGGETPMRAPALAAMESIRPTSLYENVGDDSPLPRKLSPATEQWANRASNNSFFKAAKQKLEDAVPGKSADSLDDGVYRDLLSQVRIQAERGAMDAEQAVVVGRTIDYYRSVASDNKNRTISGNGYLASLGN